MLLGNNDSFRGGLLQFEVDKPRVDLRAKAFCLPSSTLFVILPAVYRILRQGRTFYRSSGPPGSENRIRKARRWCAVMRLELFLLTPLGGAADIPRKRPKLCWTLMEMSFGHRSVVAVCRSMIFSSRKPQFWSYSSLPGVHGQRERRSEVEEAGFSIGSPARVQKLIASQSDPLLAKEILDFAARQPNFRVTNASYRIVIRKLAESKHFSLIDNLLFRLKSEGCSAPRSLFSTLIKVYAGAGFPDKVLETFYTMLKFDYKPLPKHLNGILEALVSRREYIRPAFDLFKDAHKHGVLPNTKSYNLFMSAFCSNGDLSTAYSLFNRMFKRDVVPNVESYRILMQGLCRRSQVSTAVDLLEDMLNKGYVPDRLSYTTLLNALCRKKKLKEAYKLLCRMKVKGCNPDIVHYNTVILGFCREGRADNACKVIEDMPSNGCLPDLVSYRTLVGGLCDQGLLDKADGYLVEMLSKGFSPHCSVSHGLIKGLCNVGKVERACELVEQLLRHREAPYEGTWGIILNLVCDEKDKARVDSILEVILKVEVRGDTRLVDAAPLLEEYLVRKARDKKQQKHRRR